jgi:hypothetical protein
MQPNLIDTAPRIDGPDITEADQQRLTSHLARVKALMSDSRWRTLREIADTCGCSESGASARLRDLRKPKFGAHDVLRQRITGGQWIYKLLIPKS